MSLAELQKLIAESKGEWEHLEFSRDNQVAEGYSANDLDLEEIERAVRAAVHCGRLESHQAILLSPGAVCDEQ